MATGDHVEAEDQGGLKSDTDSALGSQSANSTSSIASSLLEYHYENGRRCPASRSGTYVLRNDDQEQDRVDLTHHVLSLLLGGELYRSPPSDTQDILDVGTGTGQVLLSLFNILVVYQKFWLHQDIAGWG